MEKMLTVTELVEALNSDAVFIKNKFIPYGVYHCERCCKYAVEGSVLRLKDAWGYKDRWFCQKCQDELKARK